MQEQKTIIREKRVKEIMKKENGNINGVSVALVRLRGEEEPEILTKEEGYTDETAQNKVGPETVFGAASLSKPVFAYLALKLEEEGVIDLTKSLDDILPIEDFYRILHQELLQKNNIPYEELSFTKEQKEQIKLLTGNKALSHTSGLELSRDGKIEFKAMSGDFWYSGLPLYYLQKVIEKETKSTLEDLAKKYIFVPHEMTHSTFLSNSEPAVCAFGLYTTAEDYAKFLAAWMQDEKLQKAFHPQVSMMQDSWAKEAGVYEEDRKHVAWGLGWGLEIDQNGEVISAYHSADKDNWRAWAAIKWQAKTAIVYFANSPNGHLLAEEILSPHVDLTHVFNYFFTKFNAFTRSINKTNSHAVILKKLSAEDSVVSSPEKNPEKTGKEKEEEKIESVEKISDEKTSGENPTDKASSSFPYKPS